MTLQRLIITFGLEAEELSGIRSVVGVRPTRANDEK
jgi:hypothetical protein